MNQAHGKAAKRLVGIYAGNHWQQRREKNKAAIQENHTTA